MQPVRITGILAVTLGLAGCDEGLCGNRISQRALSPDGLREVVVYERDCGATTAFATHVLIGRPGLVPEGSSDLFVATRGNAHPGWGDAEAYGEWSGPNNLVITHDTMSTIFEQQESMDGVTVSYGQQGL